jgi:SNF2 family DNA or RNA helicase
MARVIETCKYCGKKAQIANESFLNPLKRYVWTLTCGHTVLSEKSLDELSAERLASLDGTKEAYKYQVDGVKFLQAANGTAILADDMGLGKTIQALLWLRENPESLPVLFVVKSTTIYQWHRELATWCSDEMLFWISSGQQFIPPGLKFYLISHDLMGTRERKDKATGKVILEKNPMWLKLSTLGIKTVIVDECHAFKDSGASRTGGLVRFIKEANPKFRILMSGTPILNRASEYFTALNIVAPAHFPSETAFKRTWLVADESGSLNRIAPWRLNKFKELTSRWILRREKRDVLTWLPELQRTETYVEIQNPAIRTLYNQQLDLMQNAMQNGAKLNSMDLLGYLAKLRHITAQGKAIEHGIPMIREFLENTDDTKLCVGIHHRSVAEKIVEGLGEFSPVTLSGSDSPESKNDKVMEFAKPEKRLMVANILAGGIGLNLQFCSNAMVLERQWNSAIERQFEDRFHRNGQTQKVVIDYLIAKGTIDQFFAELVEKKKKICDETVGWNLESDSAMLKDLTDAVLNARL